MKNNPNLILAVLLSLVIGCDSSTSETSQISQTYTPQKLTSSSTSQTELTSTPTPPLKPGSAKKASVITDNAILHQTPTGKVVQTLQRGTSVEIIKQKGAWFLVSSGAAKGWMHGNTIRYDNWSDSVATKTKSGYPIYKSSTKTASKPSGDMSNSSGAAAKCRDGTLSYSRNRRGTCSHHGGVALWY